MTPVAIDRDKIIAALSDKGADMPCPRCGHEHFDVMDGYFSDAVQHTEDGTLVNAGYCIPTVVVICMNCGHISQHALGVLGLQP